MTMTGTALFKDSLVVINVGLAGFGENVTAAGGQCLSLEWQPPAQGDRAGAWALAETLGVPAIEQANKTAFARFLEANPVLTGVTTAREAIAAMANNRRLVLHAGPPIAWSAMCGPVQGAILGAIVLEGWADSVEAAQRLAASGSIAFEPCHHHGAVGPMAGIISPSMPLFVVENKTAGNRAFSNMNEGLGKVLRFGANSGEVIDRLRWIASVVAPTLRATLARTGPIELKPLMAQALNMGDEVHNRNSAATALLFKRLAPGLVEADVTRDAAVATLGFIAGNDHFFLNLSMAACKAMLDAAAGVPGSSMVVAMARNGVNFGVRLSGTGDAWFEAPANPVDGLYFPGYTIADAAADLGDSAITETAGVGGFAMAAAPAIVKFVGGTPTDAIHHSLRMRAITLGSNPAFSLPALDFASAAAGIDARKVVDTGVLPVINSGIAHRVAGVGQIGAGVTTAPMACFTAAVKALAQQLGKSGEPR
ncbi:MAG TPA: DUF1116 domain-containing protein [Burkholderiaceae bacterium]|nr:DUF1116 domain-containing protein [Burkholderiaceae bacterium]